MEQKVVRLNWHFIEYIMTRPCILIGRRYWQQCAIYDPNVYSSTGQSEVPSHLKAPSPSHSERSSSSLVVIPPVQDKDIDIDWDDDEDFDVDATGGDTTSVNKDTIKATEIEDDVSGSKIVLLHNVINL